MALIPLGSDQWRCEALTLTSALELSVRFAAADGGHLEVVVIAGPVAGPVLRRLSHCAVRYSERAIDRSERGRARAAELVSAVAEAVNDRLAKMPGATTIADALGRDPTPRTVTFSRDALRALLGTVLDDESALPGGWALVDVYPSSHVRESVGDALELVLDFRRESDGRNTLIVVGPRDDTQPSFATTTHLSVRYMTLGATESDDALTVRLLVALALQVADHEGLSLRFPTVAEDLSTSLLGRSGDGDGEGEHALSRAMVDADAALNLAIDAPCGQSCAFCSVQERSPPYDGGEQVLTRYRADLRAARLRGIQKLRLNGYDPLSFSRVLDVLAEADALGFEHVDVFSPFTRLAEDELFSVALFEALPASAFFHVPLYAADSALHDRIVSRPGAFELVMTALDRIEAARGASAIHILTVVITDNVDALSALEKWSTKRGFHFAAHTPHPTYEGTSDRFFASAARQTDIARAMANAYPEGQPGPRPVSGVAPCVLLRTLGEHGVGPQAWLYPDAVLPGTQYNDERYLHGAGQRAHSARVAASVACPDADRCAMLTACGGRILRAYAERYGLDEFRAVSVRELVEQTLDGDGRRLKRARSAP